VALLDSLETEERLSAGLWVKADPFARERSSEDQCAAHGALCLTVGLGLGELGESVDESPGQHG